MYPRIKVSRVCFYDSHHIKKPLWVAAIIVGAVVDKQMYQFAARLALFFLRLNNGAVLVLVHISYPLFQGQKAGRLRSKFR